MILLDGSDQVILYMKEERFSHHLIGKKEVVTPITETSSVYKKILQSLSACVMEINRQLEIMSEGDYTEKSEYVFKGEFSAITGSLLRIQEALRDAFGSISITSEQISSGSQEVAKGATSLAQAVTEEKTIVGDYGSDESTCSQCFD